MNVPQLFICLASLKMLFAEPICAFAVYGKTCQQAMKLHGLQKGQRVCFDIKCVVEIKYHEDDSDDSEEDED